MDCSCVYVENDGSLDFHSEKIITAKKTHLCGECGTRINPGDKYEYVVAKCDGEFCVAKTCQICLEIRNVFFCKEWVYGFILEDLCTHISDYKGHISESCIAELSAAACSKVCEIIETYWDKWRG